MGRTAQSGALDPADSRFAIVVSRFNEAVTVKLLASALACLGEHGVEEAAIETVWVPGVVEIPVVAQRFAKSGRVHAVIALGAVIRGETPHFEYVSRIVADGVAQVALATGVPVVFGVLTTDTLQQAFDRIGGPAGDKGREAALTAIEMAQTLAGMA